MYITKIKKFSKVNLKFVVEALDIYLHKTILQKNNKCILQKCF